MKRKTWLKYAVLSAVAATFVIGLGSQNAWSRRRKKEPTPTPTATMTPTPTPTPIVKTWDFDQDKAGQPASGWTALEGQWVVIPDATAPSKPNTYGLPPGRLMSSLMAALNYYPMTVVSDKTEYSDFTLETTFKSVGGRFDCSGGIIFRYVDPKNFYVLSAGCPSDFFALSRMSKGTLSNLKQVVVPTDKDTWYKIKVVAQGSHFMCYDNDKMEFDYDDNKIAQGRIGLWARDDSQARFDNVTLTLPPPSGETAPAAAASNSTALPPAPPPLPPPPPAH